MRKAELQGGRQEQGVLAHDHETSSSQGLGDHGRNEEKVSRAENDNNIAHPEWQGHSAGRTSVSHVSHRAAPRSSVPIQDKEE